MADNLVKPVQTALPAVDVGHATAKHTEPPVRRKVLDPLNLSPSPRKPIARAMSDVRPDIEVELAEVRRAWRAYQSQNNRNAVYVYLSRVFALVTLWRRLDCTVKKSRAALRLRPNAPQIKPEPFGVVIFCTSDPEVVDAKTRSKWSRVLRYAAQAKPPGQRLADFIKSNGGLNECASKFRIAE